MEGENAFDVFKIILLFSRIVLKTFIPAPQGLLFFHAGVQVCLGCVTKEV